MKRNPFLWFFLGITVVSVIGATFVVQVPNINIATNLTVGATGYVNELVVTQAMTITTVNATTVNAPNWGVGSQQITNAMTNIYATASRAAMFDAQKRLTNVATTGIITGTGTAATLADWTNTAGIFTGSTTDFLAADGTMRAAGGGSAPTGTMVSSGSWSAGALGKTSDTTGTNWVAAVAGTDYLPVSPTATGISSLGLPTDPGSMLMVKPDGALRWVNSRNLWKLESEFNETALAAGPWNTLASGGSLSFQTVATTTNNGTWSLNLSTGASDRSGIVSGVSSAYTLNLAGGETFFETLIKTPAVLADGVNDTYWMFVGFFQSGAGGLGPDVCGFRYDYATNNGAWTGLTIQNNSWTTNTVGSAISAATWYRLGFKVASDQSSVIFYQNGTPIATNTTSIPSATTGDDGAYGFKIERTGGGAPQVRNMILDYVRMYKWYNSTK